MFNEISCFDGHTHQDIRRYSPIMLSGAIAERKIASAFLILVREENVLAALQLESAE